MICTGTGSAPFRAFTERRRRAMPDAPGRLLLFFGARRPEELPYFGPLQKVPEKLLGKYFCYSRVPDQPRVYVQDRIRAEAATVAALLERPQHARLYLRAQGHGERRRRSLRRCLPRRVGRLGGAEAGDARSGRYHVETY